jgi:hypothetical protein
VSSRRRRGARNRAGSTTEFWGRADAFDHEVARLAPPDDATPLISSLGPPPLPSRETIAEHYFATVYDKASSLAVALAAAADLLGTEEENLAGG